MNKTNIEWCDYTWNPIVGCKNDCYYCYAKELHNMRHLAYWDGKKLPEQYKKLFSEIQFFPERLKKPATLKTPSKIFVGSMAGIFEHSTLFEGKVQGMINEVLNTIKLNPQHTFMFLTKNPWGYENYEFPENCMLGLTMTNGYYEGKLIFFANNIKGKKFLSLEPITETFENIDFMQYCDSIEQIIIGAMSGKDKIIPQKHWFDCIKHPNILYKNNIKKYL